MRIGFPTSLVLAAIAGAALHAVQFFLQPGGFGPLGCGLGAVFVFAQPFPNEANQQTGQDAAENNQEQRQLD